MYPHLGRLINLDNVPTAVGRKTADFRAALGIIDRSIVVKSLGDTPFAPINNWGGHVVFRQGFASVQISGVLFENLGQNGLKGKRVEFFASSL